jgi:hypothetical protein
MTAVVVGPEPGSRWSARSEARTYDLDVGEDRRMVRAVGQLLSLRHGVLLGELRVVSEGADDPALPGCSSLLGLGDMTIDRVVHGVRDRVDLLRPSHRRGGRAVPLRELVAR